MEERIPQPREARGPTVVAEPEPATDGTPCDDGGGGGALLAPVVQLLSSSSGEESSDDEGELAEFEFEFPFVSRDSPAGTAAAADELFADGRIRTFYPVFGRGGGGGCAALPAAASEVHQPRVRGQLGKLFLEETREGDSSTSSTSSTSSSSSSGAATDDDGLDGVAPESYCVWRPGSSASASASPSPPTPPRKSGSTGSMARWRRISDLVVGRSHSDGREKFLFLAAAPPAHDAPRRKKPAPAPAPSSPAGARKPPSAAADADTTAAAHRIAYLARGGLGGGVPVPPGGTPRRTFLPYREELVGFFANVNGISRSHHHPF